MIRDRGRRAERQDTAEWLGPQDARTGPQGIAQPLSLSQARQKRRQEMVRQSVEARGYHVAYRRGEPNHCPSCGKGHWLVGRILAQCAFCDCAVPIINQEAGR